MAQSALERGEARIGLLLDGDDRTPRIAAMLRRSEARLTLTVPWFERDSPYRRWFGGGSHWGDDPDKTNHTYDPPEMLWFHEVRGSIGLVGCRSLGHRFGIRMTGEGYINVGMTVLGAEPGQDYRLVNGMQSVTPGLGLWLGRRALDLDPGFDEDNRLSSLHLEWARGTGAKLSPKLNLVAERGFEFRDVVPGDSAILEDQFVVKSLVARARPWQAHLELHAGLRDLVSLAAWQPFEFSQLKVTRDADPARAVDGTSYGRQWLMAQVFGFLQQGSETTREPTFLFDFGDIGQAGVARWFHLRQDFSRVIEPLLLSLRQNQLPLAAHLLQIGPAVEALGYHLARQDGLAKQAAGRASFKDRADRILGYLGDRPTRAVGQWPVEMRIAYRGVKHADRSLPESEDTLVLLRKSQLVLRLWLAKALGASVSRVYGKARTDPMGRPLTW